MFTYKLLCVVLFIAFVYVESKPLEDTKPLEETKQMAPQIDDGEMMEGAESQNPFLPRFAMKKLRERSEKANAQRRNYQGWRRWNAPQRVPCPDRYY
ncbi:hypothetical protein HF086_007883 [Spodoptera exigua]|uniref:Uncharacterized protein n=1 Tax=Spodoptera exigua TaxID=7107 RepID=A0A922SP27_SPOEX|nr:hypothetical protein HF086_007883 [Spodoptera exigua]